MLAGYLDWPGVAPVCRVQAEVKVGGEESYEVSYAITSVPREQADAATRLGWHRGHRGIENRLHWGREVTMGEDANRTWSGSGPQVLAAIRNAAINQICRLRADKSSGDSSRRTGVDPDQNLATDPESQLTPPPLPPCSP